MKLNFVIFLFLISFNLVAQPGDYGASRNHFEVLTKKLIEDPNNCELIWERIETSSINRTYFDIYKKSGTIKMELSYFSNADELFDGLNKLINNNFVTHNHNIAEFKMLRGRFYYFSGETNRALDDYLSALNYDASIRNTALNDKIYISIAAYYYNLEEKLTDENARHTLKYLNLAEPNSCHSNMTSDCFEREKIELLKFLKEEKQLINYYKKLIFSDYKSYLNTELECCENTSYIFDKNKYYFYVLKRINDLAEFYNEIQQYKKSKFLTEQLIKCLPPDSNGKQYRTFPKNDLIAISTEDYSKRFTNLHYKNQYKELSWDYKDMTGLIESIQLND
ncbi:MAG: hypothetical protein MUF43_07565 [Flavobacterium sp.]|nr:hypothetical protein [Flavobacterium sp.]